MTVTPFALSGGVFSQNWNNLGLITADNDWSGVASIVGYLGDIDAGSPTGVDPRSLTGPALGSVSVTANASGTNPTTGGVFEEHIGNPVIGLNGSGTADAPSIVIYLDATGQKNVRFRANIVDLDYSTDDATQSVAVQYRTSAGGNWIAVPGAYVADATTGPNLAIASTAIDVILPSAANNAAILQIRILTTNAVGNDELVGIDDILVSSTSISTGTLAIAAGSVAEGDSGTAGLAMVVTRSGGNDGAVSATYTLTHGSTNAADFVGATSGTISFADGVISQTILIPVAGDRTIESDETFTVTLSAPQGGVALGVAAATGTITNDDIAGTVTTANSAVAESQGGSLATVVLTRVGGSGDFSVNFATADGSATAGSDYTATLGTATFAGGATTASFAVPILDDAIAESNETVSVVLSGATGGAVLPGAPATITITDDDFAGSISIADISVTEGDAGTQTAMLTLTRSGGAAPFTVSYATANGGAFGSSAAVAGSDFVSASGTVSFAGGQNSATIPITVTGDTTFESDEQFSVSLSGPTSGATIGRGTGYVLIANNDARPTVSVSGTSGAEGLGTLAFAVTLSNPSAQTVTVTYATSDGTATVGRDYNVTTGTLTFAPGTVVQNLNVSINQDSSYEPDETFAVTLGAPINTTIGNGTAVVSILNDDSPPEPDPEPAPAPAPPPAAAPATPTVSAGVAVSSGQTIFVAGDYAQPASSHETTLSTRNNAGTTSINITGNADAQIIIGNYGTNVLDGGGGSDTLLGLLGNDSYIVTGNEMLVVENAGEGIDTVLLAVANPFVSSAGVSAFNVPINYTLDASASIEVLAIQNSAGTGAANLTGNGFDQLIVGNAGSNIINGLGGSDTMVGLGGNDTFLVRGPGDVVIEANFGGTDTVFTTVSYNLGANEVEILSTVDNAATTPIDLIGNFATQLVIGNYGDNILNGGVGGIDTLIGLLGNDLYAVGDTRIRIVENAGEGFDTLVASVDYALAAGVSIEILSAQNRAATTPLVLTGNEFGQTVAGNEGANTLNGGGGNDVLIGGGGADHFAFTSPLGAGNVDAIVDFQLGIDRIDLGTAIFGATFAAANFTTGPAATTADQHVIYDSGTGQLFYDADGSGAGAAILFATITPGLALTAASFDLVPPIQIG